MTFEVKILKALDNGLSTYDQRPFLKLAEKVGCTEDELVEEIISLKNRGKIKRFGLVVKNRSFGYVHNAMVTIDILDELVDNVGEKISQYPFVKLCYQRERVIPEWPYNLYFMIHGKDRSVVQEQIQNIINSNDLKDNAKNILFSKQCFKQKGASYQ